MIKPKTIDLPLVIHTTFTNKYVPTNMQKLKQNNSDLDFAIEIMLT